MFQIFLIIMSEFTFNSMNSLRKVIDKVIDNKLAINIVLSVKCNI